MVAIIDQKVCGNKVQDLQAASSRQVSSVFGHGKCCSLKVGAKIHPAVKKKRLTCSRSDLGASSCCCGLKKRRISISRTARSFCSWSASVKESAE